MDGWREGELLPWRAVDGEPWRESEPWMESLLERATGVGMMGESQGREGQEEEEQMCPPPNGESPAEGRGKSRDGVGTGVVASH